MKYIKFMCVLLLTSMVLLTPIINISANESDKLESGIYEVENEIYHENEIGQSMARTYLKPVMNIEVTKHKFKFIIGFTGTDYMENYRVLINDVEVKTKIVNENTEEKSIALQFEADRIDPKIKAQIYVDAMGRDVEFEIITKEETLKLIEKIEEPKEVKKEEKTVSLTEDYNKQSNNNYIMIVSIVVCVTIFIFIKFRK
ncbi:MAG: NEAT domain-containing protein [Paraclostridium sp.]